MRVLVVEDEQLLADAIARGLRRESMAVDAVYDGGQAWERIGVNDYDVVVLDRDLPGMHGDELCRQVVEAGGATRILMLTAASEVADRVAGLSLGADDYLGKPFAFSELVARVRALGRRAMPPRAAGAGGGRASVSIRRAARSAGTASRFPWPPRSSPCSRCCCGPTVPW